MLNIQAYKYANTIIANLNNKNLNLLHLKNDIEKHKRGIVFVPETSNKEKLSIWQKISEAYTHYYNTHVYSLKPWYMKFLSWFGIVPNDEKTFLTSLKSIQKLTANYQALNDTLWIEDWLTSQVAHFFGSDKGDPKESLHTISNTINNKRKLNLISHRLMGTENYKDYPEFQGLPPQLSAYKMKRELEKFMGSFAWTETQKSQLLHLINKIDETVKIMGLTVLHRYLFKVQADEALAAERVRDLSWEVHKRLFELAEGESLIIPHGYFYQEEGHAALVEVIKTKSDQFRVNFINTGLGALDHIQNATIFRPIDFIGKVKQVYKAAVDNTVPILYVDHKTFQHIQDDQLIENILAPTVKNYKSEEEATLAMTQPIKDYDKNKQLKVEDKAYQLQTNGTCAHSCWEALLSTKLDESMQNAFQLFMNKRALVKLDKLKEQYQPTPHVTQGMKRLARDGGHLNGRIKDKLTNSLIELGKHVNKDRNKLGMMKDRSSPTFFALKNRVEGYNNLIAVKETLCKP